MSVLGLIAKSSFYKVLIVLGAGMLIQLGLFHFALESYSIDFTLEGVLSSSFVALVAVAMFLTAYVFLALTGTQFGARCGYTINRLQITENQYFALQTVYNFLVFLFVWFFEAIVCYILCLYYCANAPEADIFSQTVFLGFYRSNFLHALIPLSSWHLWVRNIFAAAALAFACSQFSYKQRRGKFSLISLAVPILICRFFAPELEDWTNSVIVIIGAILVILSHVIERALKEEKNEAK